MYIYNLGLKQNIIVTLDDYLLLWWLRNCFSKKKKKKYKYNLGLKKSLVNTRQLFSIMCSGNSKGSGGGRGRRVNGGSNDNGCGGCNCCLL